MRILYVFPHPDDESFGPAKVISKQIREGHEVFLLTLTRGEATKMRLRLGLTKEEMGATRYAEMQNVAKVLGLADMKVLDFPDSGLKDLDPRPIEDAIRTEIERVRPAVVCTYAVHGISGFHDHLVGHAALKRVFCELTGDGADYLKRLALFTVEEEEAIAAKEISGWHLNHSKPEDIDCMVEVTDADIARFQESLDCYVTYKDVIEETGERDNMRKRLPFEFFAEDFDPWVDDLFAGL